MMRQHRARLTKNQTEQSMAGLCRRNVFPMLPEEHAIKQFGNYSRFEVTLNLVKAIKADIDEQYDAP
jgi:hypothetical protein